MLSFQISAESDNSTCLHASVHEVVHSLSNACTQVQTKKRSIDFGIKRQVFTHDQFTQAARAVNQYELLRRVCALRVPSRASFKLWEIIKVYDLPVNSAALFLCEAPGGFVVAHQTLVDRINPTQRMPWACVSLPGDTYESSLQTYEKTGTLIAADITDTSFAIAPNVYSLVTADGGFDYNNAQESACTHLLVCETLCALRACAAGGTFILKIFDFFTPNMLSLIGLICDAFDVVHICKPLASRPCNSERYIVARARKPDVRACVQQCERMAAGNWEACNTDTVMSAPTAAALVRAGAILASAQCDYMGDALKRAQSGTTYANKHERRAQLNSARNYCGRLGLPIKRC